MANYYDLLIAKPISSLGEVLVLAPSCSAVAGDLVKTDSGELVSVTDVAWIGGATEGGAASLLMKHSHTHIAVEVYSKKEME